LATSDKFIKKSNPSDMPPGSNSYLVNNDLLFIYRWWKVHSCSL